MNKILLGIVTTTLLVTSSYGWSLKSVLSGDESDSKLTKVQKDRSFARNYINNQKCDRVIKNAVVTTCYSDKLKSVTKVAYVIDGSNVHKVNLKKRGKWHYNSAIPNKLRSNNKDYVKTGYDKGHLAPDSAYDWNKDVLNNTYDLNINSVPMAAKVNRKTWIKSEKYAKDISRKLGYIQVIDFMVFDKKPKKMGKNKISISKGYYKILQNKEKKFKKCFYYKNNKNVKVKGDKLKQHIVDCKKVFKLLQH